MTPTQIAYGIRNNPEHGLVLAVRNGIFDIDEKLYNKYGLGGQVQSSADVNDVISRMAQAINGKSPLETSLIIQDLLDVPVDYSELTTAETEAIIGSSYTQAYKSQTEPTFGYKINTESNLSSTPQNTNDLIQFISGYGTTTTNPSTENEEGTNWAGILSAGSGILSGIAGILNGVNNGNTTTQNNTNTTPDKLDREVWVMVGILALVLGWFIYNKTSK